MIFPDPTGSRGIEKKIRVEHEPNEVDGTMTEENVLRRLRAAREAFTQTRYDMRAMVADLRMSGTFHLLDLTSQATAVQRLLSRQSEAEKLAWLGAHGRLVSIQGVLQVHVKYTASSPGSGFSAYFSSTVMNSCSWAITRLTPSGSNAPIGLTVFQNSRSAVAAASSTNALLLVIMVIEDTAFKKRGTDLMSAIRTQKDGLGGIEPEESGEYVRVPAMIDANGDKIITLIDAHGRPQTRLIAELVLEAFRGPCPPGCTLTFKDGNRLNCELMNLEWTPVPITRDEAARAKAIATRERANAIRQSLEGRPHSDSAELVAEDRQR